jgi:phage terminase large subunit
MPHQMPRALEFLKDPARYKVAWGGRGAGKSWAFARQLLIAGVSRPLLILCCRETQRSIEESVHRLLANQVRALGLEHFYTVQAATVFGPPLRSATADDSTVRTEFIFAGLKHNIDNIKSLESADIVWIEEGQTVSKDSWNKLLPTMRRPGAEVWVSFNPDFETDETYRRFVVSPPAGAIVRKVGWQDNPWFELTSMPAQREDDLIRDPSGYRHIWEGECKSAVEGAVYGKEVQEAQESGRITSVPCDRTRPVDTVWDLGYGDSTAIWFVQAINGWYHLIDYIEDDGKTIEWYLIQLQQRGYVYGRYWLPHDGIDTIIHGKLAGDRSRSIEGIMRAAGLNVRIIPKMLVTEGINAARTIFPQCRFDAEKCYEGLRALRMYQWGKPSASGIEKREPLHDAASHGADAYRGVAIAVREETIAAPRKIVAERRVMPDEYSPFG